jgi:starch-binding outer membrane protein, SusD/RagB family
MKKYIIYLFIIAGLISCSDLLEEEVFIEVGSNNFFQNDQDAQDAIYAIYAKLRSDGSVTDNNGQREGWGFYGMGEGSIFNLNEVTTDEVYVHWESFGGFFQYLEEFTWAPNSGTHFDQLFADLYEGIGIANNILENIDNDGISQEVIDRVKGETLMARGLFYTTLFSFYENIPLVLEVVTDPFSKPKQEDPAVVIQLIIDDLTAASVLLPATTTAAEHGRFTKGAALSLLARFQLNQGNFEAARDAAQDVIDLNVYELSTSYADIFSVNNDGNPEIIMSIPCIAQPGIGNTFVAHTAEPDFVSGGWGGHLIRTEFYETFDAEDIRRSFLLNAYTTTSGGAGSVGQGYMIMKYAPDPDRVGAWAGNDFVLHRYAEVLLTLAEALNEISGPNQASIDLINELRSRAFNNNPNKLVQLTDFSSKEALRAHILDERGWELYAEGYRRDDLIRHNQFIPRAQARNKNAKSYHVLFPIPQTERDKNTELNQNVGYD